MSFARIAVLALTLLEAGWMTFDGARALVVGDYVTPSTGAHAGQLGPWQYAVSAVGIAPRSTTMKLIFVIYGLNWLVVAVGFARGASWGWIAMGHRCRRVSLVLSDWDVLQPSAVGVVVLDSSHRMIPKIKCPL